MNEADNEVIEAIAMSWICVEDNPCEETTAVHWQEMITALATKFTAIREEERRAAFKEAIEVAQRFGREIRKVDIIAALEAAEKGSEV